MYCYVRQESCITWLSAKNAHMRRASLPAINIFGYAHKTQWLFRQPSSPFFNSTYVKYEQTTKSPEATCWWLSSAHSAQRTGGLLPKQNAKFFKFGDEVLLQPLNINNETRIAPSVGSNHETSCQDHPSPANQQLFGFTDEWRVTWFIGRDARGSRLKLTKIWDYILSILSLIAASIAYMLFSEW